MTELTRIVKQLERSFVGPAWHGPSVMEALAGVDHKAASVRKVAGRHTIWEISLHVAAWEQEVDRRLRGESIDMTNDFDWPQAPTSSAANWQRTLDEMRLAHAALVKTVKKLNLATLEKKVAVVGGKKQEVSTLLYGIIQHNVYHAGQIALMK